MILQRSSTQIFAHFWYFFLGFIFGVFFTYLVLYCIERKSEEYRIGVLTFGWLLFFLVIIALCCNVS